jgi:PAS domain S-box-containing protein
MGREGDQRRSEPAQSSTLRVTAEQLAEMGSWELVLDTREAFWSDNVYRIFGLQPNEIEPTPEFVIEQAHPDDRERVTEEVARIVAGGETGSIEYRIIRPDREVRNLRSTVIQLQTTPRRTLGYVQDITERRRAERELEIHMAVADVLGRWESLDRSGTRLLQALGEAMEFAAGAIWLPQDDLLVAGVLWQAGSDEAAELELVLRERRIPRGDGLPGRVWAAGRADSVIDVADDPPGNRAPMVGLHGAVAFPALKGEEVLAVLEFYSREEFASSDRLMQSLTGIGRELGHFLDRRRGDLAPPTLTPRELEVLQLAARGHTVPQIAEELVVSPDTVKTHFRHVYSKLEVNGRAAAVAQGIRLGLIE